jgi:hypothetical protein
MGFKYLLDLIKSIIDIINLRIGRYPKVKYSTGPRWLFSKISPQSVKDAKDEILLVSLGIRLLKSVILNNKEIGKKKLKKLYLKEKSILVIDMLN